MSGILLLSLLSGGAEEPVRKNLEALTETGWQDLLRAAALNKCVPLLRARLKSLDVLSRAPGEVQAGLLRTTRANAMRNLRRIHELNELVQKLAGAVPLIVLKGGRLALTHYPDVSLRTMVDLDIMAPPQDLDAVSEALRELGYAVHTGHIYEDAQHLPPFVRDGSCIELHHSLLPPKSPYTLDHDGLWVRAVPSKTPGLLYLSAEDQLLHLCLHAGYHHQLGVGAYALVDIAQMSRDPALDWSRVTERARQWGCARCVFLLFQVARDYAGAMIPDAVLEELKPAVWRPDMAQAAAAALCDPYANYGSTTMRVAVPLSEMTTLGGWRRLRRKLRERLLRPPARRTRWTPSAGVGWWDQVKPLVLAVFRLPFDAGLRRQLRVRIRVTRLAEWMEQAS